MGAKNMKTRAFLCVLSLSPLAALAQMVPAIDHTASIQPGMALGSQPVILNDKEKAALAIVREWKKNPDKPKRGPDGSVKYLYGATMPTLLCTPLQVCAIRFQPGEVVNDVSVGDQHRWKITPATIGSGASAVTTAIVKPTESGLKTSAIITTDRRMYTINLVSTRHEWMPVLAFDYPDEADRAWENYRAAQARHAYATTLPTGENIASLDFGFKLDGDNPKWKPKRVYTDGVKTYIQFPSARFADEAPALVALEGGGIFSDPSEQIVNYRLIGDRFVVDQVLERAALISGVGSDQTRVTIERVEGEK
jgi:type IV secretion system protein VirB9